MSLEKSPSLRQSFTDVLCPIMSYRCCWARPSEDSPPTDTRQCAIVDRICLINVVVWGIIVLKPNNSYMSFYFVMHIAGSVICKNLPRFFTFSALKVI